jgi:tetratricopeptide (TPR) repeat protein
VDLVRTGSEASRQTAIASLASSRYAACHEAVLELLRTESIEIRKAIVRGLAQFPRPLWSQAIYDFVQAGPEGMNGEAVNALVQVGHPRLLEVLTRALADPNPELQLQALAVLVRRPDRASEQIALDYTLKHLAEKDPQGPMLELLNRVKDPRLLPLLQNRFDASPQKSALIQSLALLGDAATAQFLRDKYDALPANEKGEVLRGLTRLAPRMFRELAESALLSNDPSMVNQALQGLNEDGGPEVVELMLGALEKSKELNVWQQLTYALANTGSPKARAALQKLRNSPDENRRNVATNALQNMRYRSPGFHHYNMAQSLVREKKYKEAVEQFGLCLTMDPEFSDALAERGLAHMHLEKFTEAGTDFRKCLQLDPANHLALTGECLTLVLADGKWEEAIRKLEAGREQHAANLIFQYNAACVYGRVVERLAKEPETPARNEQLTKYRQQAFTDLKKSLELGFRDLDLMKGDADLASLRNSPEWEDLLKSTPQNPPPRGGVKVQ